MPDRVLKRMVDYGRSLRKAFMVAMNACSYNMISGVSEPP
jgi:hypothetical protein